MSAERLGGGMRAPAHRPTYLRPGAWAAVALGGAAGTLARYGTGLLGADTLGPTVAVNLAGAFLLGVLLEVYAHHGPTPRGDRLRLLLGTGFLGGFTTYSAFARQVAVLIDGDLVAGLGYGVGLVLTGLVAAAAGVGVGGALGRRRGARP
ncbi:CrcB family protein [Georgenia yuyongxinii]